MGLKIVIVCDRCGRRDTEDYDVNGLAALFYARAKLKDVGWTASVTVRGQDEDHCPNCSYVIAQRKP